jgi:hypothetical protein
MVGGRYLILFLGIALLRNGLYLGTFVGQYYVYNVL